MPSNFISVRALRREKPPSLDMKRHIKLCAMTALERFGLKTACQVQVIYTDNARIAAVNLEQRGIDSPTDVLSFPYFELSKGDKPLPDPDTGRVYLGDILISLERVREQAHEYGHSEERELGYLTVHGVLHLLGYDHENAGDAEVMRRAEEEVLGALGVVR